MLKVQGGRGHVNVRVGRLAVRLLSTREPGWGGIVCVV